MMRGNVGSSDAVVASMQDDIIAGYHVNHEAWHWQAARLTDESASIQVGLYHPDGGCRYEFSFHWGTRGLDFATMHLHDDGFAALTDLRFASLWTALATWGLVKTPMGNRRKLAPAELVAMMQRCGLVDLTHRTRP
jgi:hypothetical protein